MTPVASADPAKLSASTQPLSPEELRKMNAYWRAANYLSVGQIYLYANPLLREPLKLEHGICAAVTLNSFCCRSGNTLLQDEPSAHAPCTRTMFAFDPIFISFIHDWRCGWMQINAEPLTRSSALGSTSVPFVMSLLNGQ